jgi:hypothetical protein
LGEIPGTGHFLHISALPHVVELTRDFLSAARGEIEKGSGFSGHFLTNAATEPPT